jgi:hypothetical protein
MTRASACPDALPLSKSNDPRCSDGALVFARRLRKDLIPAVAELGGCPYVMSTREISDVRRISRARRTGGLRVAQQAVKNVLIFESEVGVDDVFVKRRLPVRAEAMQCGA